MSALRFAYVQRHCLALAAASVVAYGLSVGSAVAAVPPLYKNCTALNKKYPHGVGKVGARDKTSGDPVTTFKRSNRIYRRDVLQQGTRPRQGRDRLREEVTVAVAHPRDRDGDRGEACRAGPSRSCSRLSVTNRGFASRSPRRRLEVVACPVGRPVFLLRLSGPAEERLRRRESSARELSHSYRCGFRGPDLTGRREDSESLYNDPVRTRVHPFRSHRWLTVH